MSKDTTRILKRYAYLARKQGLRIPGGTNGGGWLRLAESCGYPCNSKYEAKQALSRKFGHPDIWKAAGPVTYIVGKPKKEKRRSPINDAFLESYEWRKVRMQVLIRDGAKCACCGATRQDGRQMHVDHIKPRKHYPELALDPKNLQVLCDVCNHGKGNWDQTDWREQYSEPSIGSKLRLIKSER